MSIPITGPQPSSACPSSAPVYLPFALCGPARVPLSALVRAGPRTRRRRARLSAISLRLERTLHDRFPCVSSRPRMLSRPWLRPRAHRGTPVLQEKDLRKSTEERKVLGIMIQAILASTLGARTMRGPEKLTRCKRASPKSTRRHCLLRSVFKIPCPWYAMHTGPRGPTLF